MATSLAEALEGANLAVLLAAMAHLTGDESLLDRDDVRTFYRLRNPTTMPDAVAAEIRARALAVLSDPDRWPHRTPAPDELLRIATFCAGEPIAPEYTPLIAVEADFDGSDPRRFVWPEAPGADALAAFPVAVVGGGLAGVCAAIRLEQAGIPYTVYEKNPAVGGTWYENDYPALRVDVPNHFYSYSFAPNPDWSDYYSRRDELQAYVEGCVDAFGVRDHIELGTEVLAADFDDTLAQWNLRVRSADGGERVVPAKAVISAVGMLNRPSVPEIDGLASFAGLAFHSSHWPADLDVSGVRVGVIGTGASAVQLVPGIADTVAHLDVYQRSRHWMTANPVYLQRVSNEERWLFRNVPYYRGWYRFLLFWNNADRLFPAFRVDPEWTTPDISISSANDKLRVMMTEHLRTQTGDDEELFATLLPDYPPLGKRILQDGGWFEALRRDTVDLVTEPIDRIVPEGVVTADGATHELDVLVLATGFHANKFLWPMEITARGERLHERWGDDPNAYLGITVPGFPNLFCLYGPNTNPVVGSVVFMLECQVNYVVRCLAALIEGGYASMDCRQVVHDEYNARVDAEHEQMVWRHPRVHSYYNNQDGRVITNAPWTLVDYWRMTEQPDLDDYVLRHEPAASGAGGHNA